MDRFSAAIVNRHTRHIFYLYVFLIAVSVSLWNACRAINDLRAQVAETNAVVRHIKQPLTVQVYPQVVQKFDGLPGFKELK